jgi:hypothetical protein
MKTKLNVIAILLLLSLSTILHAQQWEYVNTLQNEWLQKICTQGLDTIYIVGQNGLIAKSTDRAMTWNKYYFPTKITLNDVIFINHNNGFAVGASGTILKTIDAGANWTQQTSGTTYNINAIAATGLDNIWAVGDNGLVVYSNDSGNTWIIKDFSSTEKLNDISFRNNTGYIVGSNSFSYETIDLGKTWVENDLNLPLEISVYNNNLLSVNQTINHTYILFGIDYSGFYLKVDDSFIAVPSEYFTSFIMANDTIGYGIFANMTSNAENVISITKINKDEFLNRYNPIPNNSYQLDYTHSDINIVNDTMGYFISGNYLYKISSSLINGLTESPYQGRKIILQNNSNELFIKSTSVAISSIELFTISGSKVLSENWNNIDNEKSINISRIPQGLYFINTVFDDKSSCTTKWIKQ